ncbi:MAG: ABC transporter permease [Bacilli bacterium]|nr:ABC transporter permease [Bacilli bacterium]
MISNERKNYLKKKKRSKRIILISQISILILFFGIWELLSRLNIIDTFLLSSPTKVFNTIIDLAKSNNLFNHISTTLKEILISFVLGNIIGFLIASILYLNKTLSKILDPYLTILNSLPKVALGPLIIIISGANNKSIIIMALLISSIISILNINTAFKSTDENRIKLLKSMNANKIQILTKVVIPSNYSQIVDSFKVNISMCFVGVIMGEFLVSKEGIGYLINYGSQVFNMNLVISGIIILIILTIILYLCISFLERKIKKSS